MENDYAQRPSSDLEDINEKLRKDVIRSLEAHGARQVEDLSDMTEIERIKWLFWNLHERLDEIRSMEPTLIGHNEHATDGQRRTVDAARGSGAREAAGTEL
jgi:hypothetical protein